MAVHNGHALRDDVTRLTALDDATRLREEDPYTGEWTAVVENRIIVQTSRFEVDLNRAKHEAVYLKPEDAWGLSLWKEKPDVGLIQRSLAAYDEFYGGLEKIYNDFVGRFKKFIVFDLHSYNHRRSGPDGEPADPAGNPEVNVGTGTMDRSRWAALVDRFIADLSRFDFQGKHLDVRENVKFRGRQLGQWTRDHFSDAACVLSVDIKKFFMDEWTGRKDNAQMESVLDALRSTVPGLLQELGRT